MKRICFLLVATFLYSPSLWAWGMRGHQVICEAAVFLLDSKELQDFLRPRAHMMAHLCNVPDFSWKAKGGEAVSQGSPTHYINPEVLGLAIKDIPLDFQKLQEQFEGKADQFKSNRKIFSLANDLGSLYWRTDQFFRRALDFGKAAAAATAPTGRDLQNSEHAYNKAVFQMIVNMGLLGHFVGDSSQPFHSTVDFDGYNQNHGGIHSFYEEEMVSAQDEKLLAEVVARGQKLFEEADSPRKKKKKSKPKRPAKSERFMSKLPETHFLKLEIPIEKIRALSAISVDEIATIFQNDPLLSKSTVRVENGMEIKQVARRNAGEEAAKKFRPIVVRHMARASALLAQYWDEIYEQSGRPKLEGYESYQYPFEPEFVPPDYLNKK